MSEIIERVAPEGTLEKNFPGVNICSANHLFRPGMPGQWVHPMAHEVGDCDEIITYECPVCGHRWTVELAQ